ERWPELEFDEIKPEGAVASSTPRVMGGQGAHDQEVDQVSSEQRAGIIDLTVADVPDQQRDDQPVVNPEGDPTNFPEA
ncbi:hypothetical protein U1Q18_027276, partial [Sarracenia purpurea var. burkii]